MTEKKVIVIYLTNLVEISRCANIPDNRVRIERGRKIQGLPKTKEDAVDLVAAIIAGES